MNGHLQFLGSFAVPVSIVFLDDDGKGKWTNAKGQDGKLHTASVRS